MPQKNPQKIQFLKFIAEQGMVTAQCINNYFFKGEDKINVIISTLYQLGVSRMWYGAAQGGIWQITDPKLYRLLKIYYSDLGQLKPSHVTGLNLVPHFLEMNHVRTVFEKSDRLNLLMWMSERVIRGIPVKQRSHFCSGRVPDAICWIMKKEGGQRKYFIECERHFNSTEKRYMEIFESYFWLKDSEEGHVLFLCGNKRTKRRLKVIYERLFLKPGNFVFMTLEDFYSQYEQVAAQPEAKVEAVPVV